MQKTIRTSQNPQNVIEVLSDPNYFLKKVFPGVKTITVNEDLSFNLVGSFISIPSIVTYALGVRRYKLINGVSYLFNGININGRGEIKIVLKEGNLNINVEYEGQYEGALLSRIMKNLDKLEKDLDKDVANYKAR
jgi:carbon monoxide dehydrogenase subunit G